MENACDALFIPQLPQTTAMPLPRWFNPAHGDDPDDEACDRELEADFELHKRIIADREPTPTPKPPSPQKPGQHGGWMPKAARLIVTYWKGNWARMYELIAEFIEFSPNLRNATNAMY